MNKLTQLSPQESGKALRAALKAAFPGVKFSVKMSRGTAWGNFNVLWTDGPTSSEVAKVTNKFEGKGFDGTDDSTYYMDKAIEWKGKTVLSGCGMILEQRTNSDARLDAMADLILAAYPLASGSDLACAAHTLAYSAAIDTVPNAGAIAQAAHIHRIRN